MAFRPIAAAGLATVLMVACNNSNFSGGADKAAKTSSTTTKKGGNTGGSTSGNTDGGGNGTDQAGKGGKGAGGNTGGNTGVVNGANSGQDPSVDGGANDPCAAANGGAGALGTSAPPDKAVLFYAPASYALTGGTEANTNLFVDGVVDGFKAAGWNVSVITKVGDAGVSFDACSLHKAYKQIWLWLPCNNLQNMDDASFAGVNKFYDYGGGLVVMPDNHYYVAGNLNTHCTPADWKGAAAGSDATRVADHMGFALLSGGAPSNDAPDAAHPLSTTLAPLKLDDHWKTNVITTKPAGALWLPVNNQSGFAALVDETTAKDNNGGKPEKLGLIITPVYKYHVKPDMDDVTGLLAVADYLDKHVQVSVKAPTPAGATLALTGAARSFDPRRYLSTAVTPSIASLRLALREGDKDEIGRALRWLARLDAITFDDLAAYNDENRWFVRYSAAMAASSLPRDLVVPQLRAKLNARPLTADMAVFCARALLAARANEALNDLRHAAIDTADIPVAPERDVQAELGAAITALSGAR